MRKTKLNEILSYVEELKTIKKVPEKNKKGSFIKSVPYKITLKNGETLTREKLLKNNIDGSASIIIPVTASGEILINIEPRVFTESTVSISFPAGYIEQNETPLQAAKRELEEETGYEAKEFILLDKFYQDEGISSAFNHSFIALGCEKVKEIKLDPGEVIRTTTVRYEELLELEKLGYINGSNSKLTLLRAKKYILKYRRNKK